MLFCELTEEEFWKWFKENAPFKGKLNTMKKICEAFPEASFINVQPFPPYKKSRYSNEAAVFMNKWKEKGKIYTEKSGNTWIYDIKRQK